MCRLKCFFVFFLIVYKWVFVTCGNTLFDVNKLLYECKFLWNKIVKIIEILLLKGFGIV
jgi:hypothetical protein